MNPVLRRWAFWHDPQRQWTQAEAEALIGRVGTLTLFGTRLGWVQVMAAEPREVGGVWVACEPAEEPPAPVAGHVWIAPLGTPLPSGSGEPEQPWRDTGTVTDGSIKWKERE